MKQINIQCRMFIIILFLSFIPFLIKGFNYIEAGSYTPIIFVAIFGLPILLGIYTGKNWVFRLVKTWAVLMILFGTARLLIEVAFYFTPSLDEIHIREQFTLWFNVISVAYVIAGFYLYRNTTRIRLRQAVAE